MGACRCVAEITRYVFKTSLCPSRSRRIISQSSSAASLFPSISSPSLRAILVQCYIRIYVQVLIIPVQIPRREFALTTSVIGHSADKKRESTQTFFHRLLSFPTGRPCEAEIQSTLAFHTSKHNCETSLDWRRGTCSERLTDPRARNWIVPLSEDDPLSA